MTHLHGFMKFLRSGVGVNVDPDLIKDVKPKGRSDERPAFETSEIVSLFHHPTWTGDHVAHDSTYWVALLAYYSCAREEELCGLMVDDIDLTSAHPAMIIRKNPLREIKTAARRLPLHPELIRLGFLDYVQAIRATACDHIFPDLTRRGAKTSLGNLFSKKMDKVMDEALPGARAEGKVFHSLRKSGNSGMAECGVNDSMRNQLLGHVPKGTNAKHYLAPLSDAAKLKALDAIPVATAHILPSAITISSPTAPKTLRGARSPRRRSTSKLIELRGKVD